MKHMEYIRKYYKVPAKRGARVEFYDDTYHFIYGFLANEKRKKGTIVAARGGYIRVRFDNVDGIYTMHPTWNLRYL